MKGRFWKVLAAVAISASAILASNQINMSDNNPPSSGTGWTYASGVYTILDGANVTVIGSSANNMTGLAVTTNATVNITLNNVSVTWTYGQSIPLLLNSGANVTLSLVGTNTFTAGSSGIPGIRVSNDATLTIDGVGSLTTTGGTNGNGIQGNLGNGGNIIIKGGVVIADGRGSQGITGTLAMNGNAVVFANSVADIGKENKTGGILVATNITYWYGHDEFVLSQSITIPVGYALTVGAGKTLTIPSGMVLTNNGAIAKAGTINYNGNYGRLAGNPYFIPSDIIDLNEYPYPTGNGWVFANRVYTILDGANVTITGTGENEWRFEVAEDATANITLNNVTTRGLMHFQSSLLLNSGANVKLTLQGENTLHAGSFMGATSPSISVSNNAALTINGSEKLTAVGSIAGAGNIIINGGIIYTSGVGGTLTMNGNAIIFARMPFTGTNVSTGGILVADNITYWYGDNKYSLSQDLTIPSNYVFTVEEGNVFTVPAGITLTNNATIVCNGAIINYGTINGTGTIEGNAPFIPSNTINLSDVNPNPFGINWTYNKTTNVYTILSDADVIITGTSDCYLQRGVEVAQNATNVRITLKDVVIGNDVLTHFPRSRAPLLLNNGANLTLTLEGANTLIGWRWLSPGVFSLRVAGIQVPEGATLTITGTGSLAVTGTGGAGIGGGGFGTVGNITINGGMITATGGSGSAGIGGGIGGNGGIITINGGTVTANGGSNSATNGGGAGIGGGSGESSMGGSSNGGGGGTITINGGIVTANSVRSSTAGIGGGDGGSMGGNGGSGGNITINGGMVETNRTIGGGSINNAAGPAGTFAMNGNAIVFAGAVSDMSVGNKTGGILVIGNMTNWYGDDSLSLNQDIPINRNFTVGVGKTLLIESGITLTNNATITNNGSIIVCGNIIGGGGVQGIQPVLHAFGGWETLTPATCIAKERQKRTCNICGHEETQDIGEEPLGHNFVWIITTPTSYVSAGEETEICSVCEEEREKRPIDRLTYTINLPNANFTYDGTEKRFATIEFVGTSTVTLTENEHFTATYTNNINAGVMTAEVTITGIGEYSFINEKRQFTIAKRNVAVNWTNTRLEWHNQPQAPTATTSCGSYELTVTGHATAINPEVTPYTATATLKYLNDNIILTNATTAFHITTRIVDVEWEPITAPFVYNKRTQSPRPIASVVTRQDGSTLGIPFEVQGQVHAGHHLATAIALIGDDIRRNIALTANQFKSYEILQRPLNVRLRNVPSNDTIAITERINLSATELEEYLTQEYMEYGNWATDEQGNPDNESAFREGRPRVRVHKINGENSNEQRLLRDVIRQPAVFTITERFLVEIDTGGVKIDNYIPVLPERQIFVNIGHRFLTPDAASINREGNTLIADIEGEDRDKAGELLFKWIINGKEVGTGATYILKPEDQNQLVRVEIMAALAGGRAIGERFIDGSSSIVKPKPDRRFGIMFAQNPVSDKVEIVVVLPDGRPRAVAPTVVIYDMTGNVVFRRGDCPQSPANNAITWDLRNTAGRFVANGTYLVIAEVKDRNGRTHRYSARLGVKR